MTNNSLGRAIKLGLTMIGTTIGAGFASGREIWEFFGSYGPTSHTGIFLSMGLFFLTSVVILFVSWKYQTDHYSELLNQLLGGTITKVFDVLVFVYLLTTTIVMIAGSGATFAQWDRPFVEGLIVMGFAVWLVLFFDIKGLISINLLVIPLLVGGLLFVCIAFLQYHEPIVQTNQSDFLSLPILPSALTYAALNTMSLIAVLSTMGKTIRHPREIWWAAGFSMICLTFVAFLYNYSLLKIEPLMSQYEIPLFALVQNYSPMFLFFITCVLWFAIYTTAISNLYGLVFRLSAYLPFPRWLLGLIILIILTPLSQFGFAPLVQILYPLYGVLNLFLLATLLLYPISK